MHSINYTFFNLDNKGVESMIVTAIDLDGTLLNSNLEISQRDVNAIKQAQKQGMIVAIATGRVLFDAQHILARYNLTCPIIASNGAEIYVNNKLIYQKTLPINVADFIIEWLAIRNYYYEIYVPDKILVSDARISYLQKDLERVQKNSIPFTPESFWNAIKPHFYQFGLTTFTGRNVPMNISSVLKLIIVSPDTNKLQQAKEQCRVLKHLSLSSSGTFNIEVMPSGINKGQALMKLCDYYGVNPNHCVAIGDNVNDLEMFKTAGLAIAMGNAHEKLAATADVKTLTVHECGVAYAFEHYIK
jgi:Cof subfamily protein (haloacid dehalogenase superfamily)